jgi:hypothetical protein
MLLVEGGIGLTNYVFWVRVSIKTFKNSWADLTIYDHNYDDRQIQIDIKSSMQDDSKSLVMNDAKTAKNR